MIEITRLSVALNKFIISKPQRKVIVVNSGNESATIHAYRSVELGTVGNVCVWCTSQYSQVE